MYFADAALAEIEASGKSVMTEYDLHSLVWELFKEMKSGKRQIRNSPQTFNLSLTRRTIRQLERKRLIVRDPDFRGPVWQILRAPALNSAEEAICATDPFAYVAYLSALERYGLTNRSPKALQMITYSSPAWGQNRIQMENPEKLHSLQMKPTRPHPKSIVRRRPVEVYLSKELGSNRRLRSPMIRISEIGQAFLDSLERPNLCGGMAHVIEIWANHAAEYEEEIESEIETHASPINKVRAGYLIETYVNRRSEILKNWEKFAQRGGSRKLDPDAPYEPSFSERWMLSINV